MKVIAVYDISLLTKEDQKRLNKVKKIFRRYLHHIQKSVFEGELTEAKLKKLESEVLGVIDKDRDSLIIYTFPDSITLKRKIITNTSDPLDNIY